MRAAYEIVTIVFENPNAPAIINTIYVNKRTGVNVIVKEIRLRSIRDARLWSVAGGGVGTRKYRVHFRARLPTTVGSLFGRPDGFLDTPRDFRLSTGYAPIPKPDDTADNTYTGTSSAAYLDPKFREGLVFK